MKKRAHRIFKIETIENCIFLVSKKGFHTIPRNLSFLFLRSHCSRGRGLGGGVGGGASASRGGRAGDGVDQVNGRGDGGEAAQVASRLLCVSGRALAIFLFFSSFLVDILKDCFVCFLFYFYFSILFFFVFYGPLMVTIVLVANNCVDRSFSELWRFKKGSKRMRCWQLGQYVGANRKETQACAITPFKKVQWLLMGCSISPPHPFESSKEKYVNHSKLVGPPPTSHSSPIPESKFQKIATV